ncbi:hypothetical protein [Clostridium sp. KNHs214]|uniref:hypothetical protein n=1 Tax=Clostridium sp. KNHs214 TaxID=1540257 RepID=UPI000553010B|nr:hypothetical protein [Clostridium sp. KNHs214]
MAKKRSGIAKTLGALAILSAGVFAINKLINRNNNCQSESCEECPGCEECEDAPNSTGEENNNMEENTENFQEEKTNE